MTAERAAPPGQLWRRRRRLVAMRRFWDRLAGALLALLVLASLALGWVLWSGILWPPLAEVGASPAYVVAGASGYGNNPQLALMPEWVNLLRYSPSDVGNDVAVVSSGMTAVWTALQGLMLSLQPAQWLASKPITYAAVAEQSAAPLPAQPAHIVGLEVFLGYTAHWSSWEQALGGKAASGAADPHFDRIVILPGSPVPDCTTGTGGATVDFLAGTAQGTAVALSASQYCALVSGLTVQNTIPLAEVPTPAQGRTGGTPHLPVAPGVFAPAHFPWQPVQLKAEALDPTRLAASVFPDANTVSERKLADGVQFWNQADWVLTVTGGEAALVQPAPAGAAPTPSWSAGLQQVVAYVSEHGGGWPPSTRLLRSATVGSARQYLFTTTYQGLPVAPASGELPALNVQVSGVSTQPVVYVRDVPVPGPTLADAATAISPVEAVAEVAATPPANLAPVLAASGSAQVVSLFPAWVPGNGKLEPAWAVGVADAQGVQTVLVDAFGGGILGTESP